MDDDTYTLELHGYTPVDDVAAYAARAGLQLVSLTYVPADLTVSEVSASDEPSYRVAWFGEDVARDADGLVVPSHETRSVELRVSGHAARPHEVAGMRPLDASISHPAWLREQGLADVVVIPLGEQSVSVVATRLADEELLAVVNGIDTN